MKTYVHQFTNKFTTLNNHGEVIYILQYEYIAGCRQIDNGWIGVVDCDVGVYIICMMRAFDI